MAQPATPRLGSPGDRHPKHLTCPSDLPSHSVSGSPLLSLSHSCSSDLLFRSISGSPLLSLSLTLTTPLSVTTAGMLSNNLLNVTLTIS